MYEMQIIGDEIWYRGYLIGNINDSIPPSIRDDFTDRYSKRDYYAQNYGMLNGKPIYRGKNKHNKNGRGSTSTRKM
jgi:hypothetical protein